MTKITRSADCGNSPKNKALEDLAVALEGGPWDVALLGPETRWLRPKGRESVGADAIAEVAGRRSRKAIRIERVSSHGKAGAVSGVADGKAFAHIFTFTTAAAKQLATIDSFRKTETTHG